jgi:hypothetical protein
MQLCTICQKYIEPNRVSYRCGDMDTCSQECNVKRLECLYVIDPNLSSPVKWIVKSSVPGKTRSVPTNMHKMEKYRDKECCREEYRHEIYQRKHHATEKIKFRRHIPSSRYYALIAFVSISILLYNVLFLLII